MFYTTVTNLIIVNHIVTGSNRPSGPKSRNGSILLQPGGGTVDGVTVHPDSGAVAV
jgi:hypothetical protein